MMVNVFFFKRPATPTSQQHDTGFSAGTAFTMTVGTTTTTQTSPVNIQMRGL
jgi:hypothetical protein